MQRNFHLSISSFDQEAHELFLSDQLMHKHLGETLYRNLFYVFPYIEFYPLQGRYFSYKAFALMIKDALKR
jgi:hypothetical protein